MDFGRLIEDRDFSPIGSNKKIPSDIRLITSADTSLEIASREGVFREDLRFRLDVISVSVPPLRDRGEDILPLFHTFLEKALGRRDINKTEIDVLLIDCLRYYKWPGNVRELENLCSKIAVQIESDYEYLSVNILPSQILESVLDDYDAGADMIALDQLEKEQLQRLLEEFPDRMDSAAKFLGVSPMSLLKKVKKLNLQKREKI
ncbi:MAG: sigma 54-interacting transcriptional regulator [Gammaproteobacteria bacterium]|mgnify:FL=1|nr:sigma 54-interacting transcriptional regulator [Gammaproteobacteria bacterium]